MADILIAVAVAWLCAQIILKPVIESFKRGRFAPEAIWQRGGMPSGHAALVGALASAVAKTELLAKTNLSDSPILAVCLVLSILVIYDALVTRKILHHQGDLLQSLTKKPVERIYSHEPFEVVAGLVMGAVIAWWLA